MAGDNLVTDSSNSSSDSDILDKQLGCKNGPIIKTLKELVDHLIHVFQSDYINVEQVHRIMSAYDGDYADWEMYANFDKEKLTRNLVDTGNGKYNLILVCWEGGHKSTVHDHANCHCFMRQLQGSLDEIRYDWPDHDSKSEGAPLREIARSKLCCPRVSYMNDEIGLHRMENASQVERAVSLHLYCPPFSACTVFDKESGQSIKCPVTFWSKFGKKQSA